jgi:hypothetical protein
MSDEVTAGYFDGAVALAPPLFLIRGHLARHVFCTPRNVVTI